jgi:hypothetical protein
MAKLPAAAKTTKVKSPACFCCQNPRSNLVPFSSSTFGVMKERRRSNTEFPVFFILCVNRSCKLLILLVNHFHFMR